MREQIYLGQQLIFKNGNEMAEVFFSLSRKDEEAAQILFRAGYYNQAIFLLIQSMEKYIKHIICKKVDISKVFFADKLRDDGHNFDKSIDFLITIIAGNQEVLAESLKKQFKKNTSRAEVFYYI